jgi:hypothetical protein
VGNIDKLEFEHHHVAEEMVEHLILEKVGALPDHGHAKGIRLKKKIKRVKKSYDSEFFILLSVIIVAELWYLWNYFIGKYPDIEQLFLF